MRGSENEITSSRKISSQLVKPVGFSNGCAELALKKPPPLVPSSLMTSCEATGPPGIDWVSPPRVAMSWKPWKFWIMPLATITSANTIDSGSSRRSTIRVRSTQKLPTRSVLLRVKPRIRAATIAMPTAAETKFCTARPAIWTTWPSEASPA